MLEEQLKKQRLDFAGGDLRCDRLDGISTPCSPASTRHRAIVESLELKVESLEDENRQLRSERDQLEKKLMESDATILRILREFNEETALHQSVVSKMKMDLEWMQQLIDKETSEGSASSIASVAGSCRLAPASVLAEEERPRGFVQIEVEVVPELQQTSVEGPCLTPPLAPAAAQRAPVARQVSRALQPARLPQAPVAWSTYPCLALSPPPGHWQQAPFQAPMRPCFTTQAQPHSSAPGYSVLGTPHHCGPRTLGSCVAPPLQMHRFHPAASYHTWTPLSPLVQHLAVPPQQLPPRTHGTRSFVSQPIRPLTYWYPRAR